MTERLWHDLAVVAFNRGLISMARADGKGKFVWLGDFGRRPTGDQDSLCRTGKHRQAWDLKR